MWVETKRSPRPDAKTQRWAGEELPAVELGQEYRIGRREGRTV